MLLHHIAWYARKSPRLNEVFNLSVLRFLEASDKTVSGGDSHESSK
jgi:hypothetical protein